MYDLAIIGAGWAGFNAALKAKELGLKICLIEKSHIGGTCLNRGCIPTKSLIQSAKIYSLAKKSLTFGIEISSPQVNFLKVQERKEKVISQLRLGMQTFLKGVDFISGDARLISNTQIQAGGQAISAKNILIATGSMPIELPAFKFDSKAILSSDDILNLKEIPASLLIIGGGVIGCEFACLFSVFGTQVTVVEKMPQLLPGEDSEIARKIELAFKKKGIKAHTNTDAQSFDSKNYSLTLSCVGRSAKTSGLGLEEIGVKLERNKIIVDERLRANIDNIYGAGDCTGKVMLAHFAAYQGAIAAHNCAYPAGAKKADNNIVPACIFTDPEVASVGLSEEKAKAAGIEAVVSKFDFMGSGMARIMDETEGFIKVISEAKSGQLLGASIVGPKATELIASFALAVTNKLTVTSIKETIFAHPTLSESIHESL